jgi:hypothetical protein
MDTVELIKKIVLENHYIDGINIHRFPNAPSLENRLIFTRNEYAHYQSALKLRETNHVPFWDALMLSFYNNNEFADRILENVLDSHAKREKELVPRDILLNSAFLPDLRSNDINYAINSQVVTKDGKKRHILLLDFHIPENSSNQIIVEKVLEILNLKGYLLRSGRSYHFIGEQLISTYRLISIISKCLFFTPIIDKSWIAHQLVDKSCSLRFTKKNGIFPTLLKVL